MHALMPNAASLIADTGHPHFPYWQAVALAAVLAAIVQATLPDPAPARLYRGARVERVFRPEGR